MPKLKLTKTALKAQTDDLKRFTRFLPTLQLKKQQLQLELRKSQALLDANRKAFEAARHKIARWSALFGDPGSVEFFSGAIRIAGVDAGEDNIAGVIVPVFDKLEFELAELDLFATDFYTTEGVKAVCELLSLVAAGRVLERRYELLAHELRTTTQRVNLFEKVKIPECRENIRKIRIYISDQETSAVARSKLAKNKAQASDGEGESAA